MNNNERMVKDIFMMYDYIGDAVYIEYRVFDKEDDIDSFEICISYDTEDNKVKLYWYRDYSEC